MSAPSSLDADRSRRRWTARRLALVALAVVVALLAVGVGALALLARDLEQNVQREQVFEQLEEEERPEPEPTRALDILVLGSDSREGVGPQYQGSGDTLVEGERADTTLIVHINADRDAAWVVSIPRDSWVELPACRGRDGTELPAREGQFNAAFLDGGLSCTVRAVEELTGVRIDHTAVVDFRGFRDMVDALGGVPVCLDEPFTPQKADVELPAGRTVLDGRQGLEFVRARYGVGNGSDIDRIERQKRFMASMLDRALSRDLLTRPDRLVRFLSAATENLRVDEDLDLRQLAMELRGIDPADVTLTTVPLDPDPGPAFQRGGPQFGRVAWDQPAAEALFADLRADRMPGDEPPAAPSAPVEEQPAAPDEGEPPAPEAGEPPAAPDTDQPAGTEVPGTTAAQAACR